MNDKEYTYDIDKYTIGVDENGEDGIGMTVAKIENGGIKFLGNCYGENARCIDLLIKENKELKLQLKGTTHCFDLEEHEKLKKQLEEYKRLGFKHLQDKNNNLETQQKEFIKFLEDNYKETQDIWYIKILQKYKEIIGVSDDKTN